MTAAVAIDPVEHLEVVGWAAAKYIRRCPSKRDDILAAGNLGLVLAARKYPGADPAEFPAYARKAVSHQILRMLMEDHLIRIPKHCLSGRRRYALDAAARAMSAKFSGFVDTLPARPAAATRPEFAPGVRAEGGKCGRFALVAACGCGAEFRSGFAEKDRADLAGVAARFRARAAAEGWSAGPDSSSCPACRPPCRLAPPRNAPGLTRLGRDDEEAIAKLFAAGYRADEVAGWFGIPPALAINMGNRRGRRATA